MPVADAREFDSRAPSLGIAAARAHSKQVAHSANRLYRLRRWITH
jgi:hypothetical protein